MPLSLSQLTLAVITIAMQVSILLLAGRKQRTNFPLFFGFVAFNAAAMLMGLIATNFGKAQYFYVYWTLSIMISLVGFAVLYEVFVSVLKPYSAVIDLGKMLFMWAGLFLLLAAFLTALVTNGAWPKKIMIAMDMCDRCVHLMQCGMLMLLVFFERRLNISWRSPGISIGLGLGILAAVDLSVSYAEARFAGIDSQLLLLNSFSFLAVLGFWLLRLRDSSPARKPVTDPPTRLILQRWNEALVGYGYGDVAMASGSVDSFLPIVERTVDRVMARKMVN